MPDYKIENVVPTKQWLELPLVTQHIWDCWPLVDGALQDLEQGIFVNPALMADAMLMDDRVVGTVSTRINALLGCDLEFESPFQGEGESLSGEAAKVAEQARRYFQRMCPTSALADWWRWGRLLGVGLGELVWSEIDGMDLPTLKVWHPENLSWRWDTRSYWIVTQGLVQPDPLQQPATYFEIHPGEGQWATYTPFRERYGWMHGLIRPLSRLWISRQFNLRDWSRWGERNALGVTKAFVPDDANEEDKAFYLSQISNMASEPTVLLPRRADGTNAYDIEMLEATSATNWQSFHEQQKQWDINIAVTVLGQNLTTEVNGGSRAAAQVHENVRQDFLKDDAQTLGQAVYEMILRPWALYNFGDANLAPFPRWQVSPSEDKKDVGTFHSGISRALVNYKTAGAPVDYRALLDGLAIPMIPEGQTAEVLPVAALPEQPSMSGAPEVEEKPADQTKEPEEPKDDRVLQSDKVHTAIPMGVMRGQLFADGLAENSKRSAKEGVGEKLKQIIQLLHASSDYESAKHNVLKALGPHATTRDVARLTEQVLVLGALAGRLSATEDL